MSKLQCILLRLNKHLVISTNPPCSTLWSPTAASRFCWSIMAGEHFGHKTAAFQHSPYIHFWESHHRPLPQRVLHGGSVAAHWDPWGMEQWKKNKSLWGSLKLTDKLCFWCIETTNLGGIQWIVQALKYQCVKTSNLHNAVFCFRKFHCVFSRHKIFQGKNRGDLETTNQGNRQWPRVAVPAPTVPVWAALPGESQGRAVPAPHGCFPQGVNPKAQREHFNVSAHHSSKAAASLVIK